MPSLAQQVDSWGSPAVLVAGDVMLDRYTFGVAERLSPEAPVPVLSELHDHTQLGGAASVARLLSHLDCRVSLMGLVGDDAEAAEVRRLLTRDRVDQQVSLLRQDATNHHQASFPGAVWRTA